MSDNDSIDSASFSLGAFVGFFVTFLLTVFLTMTFVVNKWHNRTCHEQFNQAATASDSLEVVRDDAYCNTRLDR